MAWMTPLSHATSAGQDDDFDAPSDLRPMIALSSQFLRNLRYEVRVPPWSVGWSTVSASSATCCGMTWYLRMSAVMGVPTSTACLSIAESDGARSVYGPPALSADERALIGAGTKAAAEARQRARTMRCMV